MTGCFAGRLSHLTALNWQQIVKCSMSRTISIVIEGAFLVTPSQHDHGYLQTQQLNERLKAMSSSRLIHFHSPLPVGEKLTITIEAFGSELSLQLELWTKTESKTPPVLSGYHWLRIGVVGLQNSLDTLTAVHPNCQHLAFTTYVWCSGPFHALHLGDPAEYVTALAEAFSLLDEFQPYHFEMGTKHSHKPKTRRVRRQETKYVFSSGLY